tara:strand:- start:56 stop:235 length:180 start_codon:yes stop_codon:yes gene_type:complete
MNQVFSDSANRNYNTSLPITGNMIVGDDTTGILVNFLKTKKRKALRDSVADDVNDESTS